jgi:hypothetical protein
MIKDIRAILNEVNTCKNGQCECQIMWDCDKAWDALDDIEKTVKQYESLQQRNVKEPPASLSTIDAWDVIG